MVTGLGILAYGLLAFSLGVRYLRVVDHRYVEEETQTIRVRSSESIPAKLPQ